MSKYTDALGNSITPVVIVDPSGTTAVAGGQNQVNLATLISGEDQTNNVTRSAPKSGFWMASSVPAVSTAPSASRAAAGAGVKNVLTGFSITLNAIAAQTIIYFTLRDGATGAGTILHQWYVVQAIGTTFNFGIGGLYVPGSANVAMTIELTNQTGAVTAPVATNFASVLMWGNTEQ